MSDRVASIVAPAYALAAGVIVLLDLPPVIGAVCFAPLVLFVPGYTLLLALRVRGRPEVPGRRIALAVALTIACIALGGLVLNALFALTTAAWAVWLIGVTCFFAVPALMRNLRVEALTDSEMGFGLAGWRSLLSARSAVSSVLVLLCVGGAVTLTEVSARSAYDKPVTQLSLLPVTVSGRDLLQLVVASASNRQQDLTLTLRTGTAATRSIALRIRANKTWVQDFPVPRTSLSASLARGGEAQPFSRVVWSNPAPRTAAGGRQRGTRRQCRSRLGHGTTPAGHRLASRLPRSRKPLCATRTANRVAAGRRR